MFPTTRIWAIALVGCIAILPVLLGPIILGVLVDFGGFSDRAAGFTSGFGAIGSVTVAIICALNMHRLPLRRLATLGMATAAITSIAAAFIYEQRELFYLMRGLGALGDGACYAAVMASYARERNSERCYGLFMMLQFGLAAVGLYVLPTWLPDMNVTQMFLGFAVLKLAALALAIQLPDSAADAEGITLKADEWRLIIAVPALAGLALLCFFEASNTGTDVYMERVAVSIGLTDAEIGSSLSIASLMGVPGAFAILWLGKRLGHQAPIWMGLTVGAVSLYLVLAADDYTNFILWASIHSATWAFTLPYIQSFLADMDPGGAVVAAGSVASGAGGGLGPSATAMLVTAQDYSGIMIVGLGAYGLAGLALIIAVWQRRQV